MTRKNKESNTRIKCKNTHAPILRADRPRLVEAKAQIGAVHLLLHAHARRAIAKARDDRRVAHEVVASDGRAARVEQVVRARKLDKVRHSSGGGGGGRGRYR